MSNKNTGRWLSGKGYYIALILCATAIGISGYLYYRNVSPDPVDDTAPGYVANVADTGEHNVPAVATNPGQADAQQDVAATSEPANSLPIRTASPVEGETVAGYAMDCLSYNATTRDWRVHNGVDIAAEAGTEVLAAADGTVYTIYEDDTMGHTVVIRHNDGYTTLYASLDPDLKVAAGDKVKLGDVIGTVGCSALLESAIGDHVHFSVTRNDEPMDPAAFLRLGN